MQPSSIPRAAFSGNDDPEAAAWIIEGLVHDLGDHAWEKLCADPILCIRSSCHGHGIIRSSVPIALLAGGLAPAERLLVGVDSGDIVDMAGIERMEIAWSDDQRFARSCTFDAGDLHMEEFDMEYGVGLSKRPVLAERPVYASLSDKASEAISAVSVACMSAEMMPVVTDLAMDIRYPAGAIMPEFSETVSFGFAPPHPMREDPLSGWIGALSITERQELACRMLTHAIATDGSDAGIHDATMRASRLRERLEIIEEVFRLAAAEAGLHWTTPFELDSAVLSFIDGNGRLPADGETVWTSAVVAVEMGPRRFMEAIRVLCDGYAALGIESMISAVCSGVPIEDIFR
jgi:hypothetical protein